MRYRRVSFRYAAVATLPVSLLVHRVALLAEPRWRPDADLYETPEAFVVTVDLPGVDEEALEVAVLEDGLLIEGTRPFPECGEAGFYHYAQIRRGPFRLALPLPSPVEPDAVTARYERGLLTVRLPRRAEGRA
jgi:HSP20 family protein